MVVGILGVAAAEAAAAEEVVAKVVAVKAAAGTRPLLVVVVVMPAQGMGFHIHCTLCMIFDLWRRLLWYL